MSCYIIIIIMFFCRKRGFTNNYVKDNIHRKATGGETHENVSNVFTKFTNGEEIIEDDGFINPKDAKFTLCTAKVVPILATNQKSILEENKEQAIKISNLEERIVQLEALIQKLL